MFVESRGMDNDLEHNDWVLMSLINIDYSERARERKREKERITPGFSVTMYTGEGHLFSLALAPS